MFVALHNFCSVEFLDYDTNLCVCMELNLGIVLFRDLPGVRGHKPFLERAPIHLAVGRFCEKSRGRDDSAPPPPNKNVTR